MNRPTTVNDEFQRHIDPKSALLRQTTVGEAIRCYAEIQPDRVAIASSSFAPLLYRELQLQIGDIRGVLRRAGFGRGARIAVAMPNGPHAALAVVAVSCASVSIPLDPRQTVQEIERCLGALRPDAVLLLKGSEFNARQAAETRGVTIIEATQAKDSTIGFNFIEPRAKSVELDEPNEPDPDAPAFILQTSGTTAEPKLIPFSHRNLLAAAARHEAWFELTPLDCCLSVSPLFYSHGLKVTVFTPLLTGGAIALPVDISKFDYTEWFENLRPTWYSAGPTLHRLVLDRSKSNQDAKIRHTLRFITGGGAPLPRHVLEGLQQTFGVPVLPHYGSSEAALIASNTPVPGRSKPGTCGIPWPGTLIIVAEDGTKLPPGAKGEILIGGPTLMSGYLNASELNRASFVDGWFRTGDIGVLDEDGFLTLYGRKDEMINRGGEKISPIEVDDALMSHPAVAEAAAFPVSHPRLGEDVAAAVVLRSGMMATPVELRRYLQDHVASFKIPRRIVISDQLPKGATGKVLRRRLAELFEVAATAKSTASDRRAEDGDINLLSALTTIWEQLLNLSQISLDDDFFERGGDSLLAMELLAELEKLTGQAVSASVLLDAPTIRLLTRKLSERGSLGPKHLVRIHSNGSQPPIIFFHGDFRWGGGPLTGGLTNLLGPDQPIFIVIPHGTGDEPIPTSIKAMASDRLPLIVQAQPEGPYRLCGNCLGGIVAFEVARLLLAAGKEVEMVFMIDPPTINANTFVQLLLSTMRHARPFFGSVLDHAMAWTWYRLVRLQKFWNMSWTRRWAAIKFRMLNPGVFRSNERTDAAQFDDSNVLLSPFSQFADPQTMRYAAAMSYYIPQHLAVRVIYFSVDFGVGAWRRLSPNLEVIKSPGTHTQFDIPKLANELKGRLQAGK